MKRQYAREKFLNTAALSRYGKYTTLQNGTGREIISNANIFGFY